MTPPRVLLLIGPAGSGKTTLGRRIARNEGWVHVSEDDLWNEIGHPSHALRTDEGQARVQARAHERLRAAIEAGRRVVFEFLVYENPPRRIRQYQAFLESRDVPYLTKVLRPSVETILERQRLRGRPSDRDVADRRAQAEHQLACLRSDLVRPEWVIDSSDQTLEETYVTCFVAPIECA